MRNFPIALYFIGKFDFFCKKQQLLKKWSNLPSPLQGKTKRSITTGTLKQCTYQSPYPPLWHDDKNGSIVSSLRESPGIFSKSSARNVVFEIRQSPVAMKHFIIASPAHCLPKYSKLLLH